MERRGVTKLRTFEVSEPTFNVPLFLLVGPAEEASEWVHKHLDSVSIQFKAPGSTWHIKRGTGTDVVVVYMREWKDTASEISSLSHESLHAARALQKIVGVHGFDEESVAYLISNIMFNAVTLLRSKPKK